MDPSQPSQPPQNAAYITEGNPAETVPSEDRAAQAQSAVTANSAAVEQRGSSTQAQDAVPSSLGRGVRGGGPGEESKGYTQEQFDGQELEGEQMRAPGEGDVATAVGRNPGGGGEKQMDFASDLDRKKAEQAPAREAIKAQRGTNVDVAGVLSDRGGPANPVS